MQLAVGIPGAMSITPRHFAKRAPSPWYSVSRSRRLSRPSVTFSPGDSASFQAPLSTLIPGIAPVALMSSTSGVPSLAFWRIVSS
jgi:hypothetical protein